MCFTVQLSRFLSFWQLWYFIISFLACQELFSKVFYQPFGCAVLFFDSHTRLSHLYWFVKNFLKLFHFVFFCFLTAFIRYHVFLCLSTSFFIFWNFIDISLFCCCFKLNCHQFLSDSLTRISHSLLYVNYFFIYSRTMHINDNLS